MSVSEGAYSPVGKPNLLNIWNNKRPENRTDTLIQCSMLRGLCKQRIKSFRGVHLGYLAGRIIFWALLSFFYNYSSEKV